MRAPLTSVCCIQGVPGARGVGPGPFVNGIACGTDTARSPAVRVQESGYGRFAGSEKRPFRAKTALKTRSKSVFSDGVGCELWKYSKRSRENESMATNSGDVDTSFRPTRVPVSPARTRLLGCAAMTTGLVLKLFFRVESPTLLTKLALAYNEHIRDFQCSEFVAIRIANTENETIECFDFP